MKRHQAPIYEVASEEVREPAETDPLVSNGNSRRPAELFVKMRERYVKQASRATVIK
jgi:hypothetical protein